MVRIDGTRVKILRERLGLTQLYIASVVQVTTDTISRWENKKYPKIKRENAIKLAEALEVCLDEIIEEDKIPAKQDSTPPEPIYQKPADKSFKKIWPILVLSGTIGVLIIFVTGLFFSQPPSPKISATRILPRYCTPKQPFPVAIEVTGASEKQTAVILRENLPDLLRIHSTYPAVSPVVAQNNHLKWLSKIEGPTFFVYTASLSGSFEKNVTLEGSISASRQDDTSSKTKGDDTVQVSRFHWADKDGDNIISDQEILTAYDLYGDIDALRKDIDLVEEIWLGTGYRWNQVNSSYDIIP